MCDAPLGSTWLLGSVRFVFCLSALLKQLNVKVARGLCCAAGSVSGWVSGSVKVLPLKSEAWETFGSLHIDRFVTE